jgi:hypothetical protein
MTDIGARSFGRWLGISALIIVVLALSACHRHYYRHHRLSDVGYSHHAEQQIAAYR